MRFFVGIFAKPFELKRNTLQYFYTVNLVERSLIPLVAQSNGTRDHTAMDHAKPGLRQTWITNQKSAGGAPAPSQRAAGGSFRYEKYPRNY